MAACAFAPNESEFSTTHGQHMIDCANRYREALEKIADEERSECGCEAIGSHVCDVREIAREALQKG